MMELVTGMIVAVVVALLIAFLLMSLGVNLALVWGTAVRVTSSLSRRIRGNDGF